MSNSAVVHLIDDDEDVRRALAFLLSAAGLAVRGLGQQRQLASRMLDHGLQAEADAEDRQLTRVDRVQQVGGGDLLVDNAMITIGPDGTVMDGDHANGAVAVFDTASPDAMRPLSGGRFTARAGAMAEVDPPAIHQGMIEASNVETSDEMVEMMAALQHAQSGARLVQVYDELMGEALTSLGRDNR